MKHRLFILCLLVAVVSSVSGQHLTMKNYQGKLTRSLRLIQIDNHPYCDYSPITNLDWREYLFCLEQTYGKDSEQYRAALPDETVLRQQMPDSLVWYYLHHPMHNNSIVLGAGSWMESISISKGVSSVTNGYEAITGQINVDFKKPETSQERLFLNLYGNTMGRGEMSLNTRFNVGKKEQASTMLLLSAADQFAKMDMNKDGFLDVPRNQQVNVMNRWDYMVPEKLNGRTMVGFVWDNRVGGQKKYNWKNDFLSNEIYGVHLDNKRLDIITKNGILLKGADESIGTIASYTGTWLKGVFGLRTVEAQQHSTYLNILYSNKFGKQKRHKLTAGGSAQYDYYTCLFGGWAMNGTERYTSGKVHEAVPGIYGEYSYIIDKKLVVMTGMRLDYNFYYQQLFWTPS